MAKQNPKQKYGFEASSDEVAGILWRRLFEFIRTDDRNKFCTNLRKIAKLELLLQGEKSPKEGALQAQIAQYFVSIVPKIYDYVMLNFKKLPKTYFSYGEKEYLEQFKENDYHFYKLDHLATQLIEQVKSKYRK